MRVALHTITSLASQGRLTLQIPQYIIEFQKGKAIKKPTPGGLIDFSDDFFCMLKGGTSTPCIGKERGFTYLTQKGFKFFYRDLETAFKKAYNNGIDRTNGVGWPEFVQHASDHFAMVKKRRKKRRQKLLKDLQDIRNFVI
jgi:hypothetical protein